MLACPRAAALAVAFIPLVWAWQFDQSCIDLGYDTYLRAAVGETMTLAKEATVALTTTPRNSHLNDVAQWLIGSESQIEAASELLARVTNQYLGNEGDAGIVFICDVYNWTPLFKTVRDPQTGLDQTVATGRSKYNGATNHVRIESDILSLCKSGQQLPMVSNNRPPGSTPQSWILICPDLLANPYMNEYSAELSDTPATAAEMAEIKNFNSDYTEMDSRTTVDVALLHEFLHMGAIMPVCGETEQNCPAWKLPFAAGRKFGGALDLALGLWAPSIGLSDGLHNAHSVALLASAASLIVNKGLGVQKDGTLFTI